MWWRASVRGDGFDQRLPTRQTAVSPTAVVRRKEEIVEEERTKINEREQTENDVKNEKKNKVKEKGGRKRKKMTKE